MFKKILRSFIMSLIAVVALSNYAFAQNTSTIAGGVANAAKEVYEAKVGIEALERAGNNPNLKGIVHEIQFRDLKNFYNTITFNGNTAVLTKASNAVRDDVIVKNAKGFIVERFQLKDTPSSIQKVIQQVSDGKYNRTVLAGTTETVEKFEEQAAKITGKTLQKMVPTGVSSSDTVRIANKALGNIPVITDAFKSIPTPLTSAVPMTSAAVEAYKSYDEYKAGKMSGMEYTGKVAGEGVKSYVAAEVATVVVPGVVAGSTVGAAATAAVATVVGTAAAPVVVGAAVAVGVWYGAKSCLDYIF